MIELDNIHHSFGKEEVIKGISLHIKKGETVVLLGLSGSGKTTTLKLMNGLLSPNRGKVSFNSQSLSELNILEVRQKMGYVIHQGGLFPRYTVLENVALVPRLLKWPNSKIISRAKELFQKLDLDPTVFFQKYPDQLSGGQQQRVGIARALAANPPVLLMDEPFGALDPITRQSIRREFLELDELKEKTVVMVTHDVQEAFEMADRIAVMHEGKIIQMDTPQKILDAPADSFVKEFILHEYLILSLKSKEHQNKNLYYKLNEMARKQSIDWQNIISKL